VFDRKEALTGKDLDDAIAMIRGEGEKEQSENEFAAAVFMWADGVIEDYVP